MKIGNDITDYIPVPTMGEILQKEFMTPMKISADELAQKTKIPVSALQNILRDQLELTGDVSLELERYFGLSEGYLIDMQHDIAIRELKNQSQ